MKKFFERLVVTVAISCITAVVIPMETGCAALASALPDVIAAVTSGAQILDAIESFMSAYFAQHPDPATQVKVAEAITKARIALNVALNTAKGAKNANDQQVDQAFDAFKAAYLELLAIVRPFGVVPQQNDKMLRAPGPGQLSVPAEAPTPKGGAR